MAFVPEGQADSSQARSAWVAMQRVPSRRDGRSLALTGRRKNEVEGKQEVRRRSTDAELGRTAFARETEDVLDLVQVSLACQP